MGTEYKDENVFISVITIKAKLLFYVISRQCYIILGPGVGGGAREW